MPTWSLITIDSDLSKGEALPMEGVPEDATPGWHLRPFTFPVQ